MGYTTDFDGHFTITPGLTAAQIAYLEKFHHTRHMKRDADKALVIFDSERTTVGLPIGADGQYFVGGKRYSPTHDASVLDVNQPPSNQPSLWCPWFPSVDGCWLQIEQEGSRSNFTDWAKYIIDHFLAPWGRTVNGEVSWAGEDPDDRGILYAWNNRIQAVKSRIVNDGPIWAE